MIDVNLNDLRILPSDHLAFKDLEFNEGTQQENKYLKTALIILLIMGGLFVALNLKEQYENKTEK